MSRCLEARDDEEETATGYWDVVAGSDDAMPMAYVRCIPMQLFCQSTALPALWTCVPDALNVIGDAVVFHSTALPVRSYACS